MIPLKVRLSAVFPFPQVLESLRSPSAYQNSNTGRDNGHSKEKRKEEDSGGTGKRCFQYYPWDENDADCYDPVT